MVLELDEFLAALKQPRKIMIMAGAPVDSMIDQLLSRLDEGDIIDGGNLFWRYQRRFERCRSWRPLLGMAFRWKAALAAVRHHARRQQGNIR